MRLEPAEQDILASVEQGAWRSVRRLEGEQRRYRRYARATFRKDRRVNIRISRKDLEAIQKRALEEGLPYQTLISSLLRKYVAGRMREARGGAAGRGTRLAGWIAPGWPEGLAAWAHSINCRICELPDGAGPTRVGLVMCASG